MNHEQILQVLYEMALVTSSETSVKPLITKTMQRLLYHTAFPCGLFLSDIKSKGDDFDVYVEEVIGGGLLRNHKDKRLILPKEFLYGDSVLFSIIEDVFEKNIKYKTVLRLPVSDTEQFVLLSIDSPKSQLSFGRIFEPVLKNFGKTLSLSRKNEHYTGLLEGEISRRVKLEASLRESEERHRTIFESTVDGIININSRGIIESLNPAIEKMFGYKSSEMIGNNIGMLMPEPMANQHDMLISKFIQTGHKTVLGKTRELFAMRKDKTVFPVDIALDDMIINNEKMFTGIIRDVSERKEAELNIIKAKEEAEHANNVKSEFLSSMSHELRTPLNAILGFSQLLKMNKNDDLTNSNIQEIINAGEHLLQLITQILDLSKIESGNIELSIGIYDVNTLINNCVSIIKPIADSKFIHVDNKVNLIDTNINVDEMRFKQIILNLLSNAVKYNSNKGKIILSSSQAENNMLRLSILDTGKGLSQEQQKDIFIPFERLGAEHSDIEGTGLGLTISKNLIERMGGSIGVESEVGKGSCFWIQVPLS